MNDELLKQLYSAKSERRKLLRQLPIEERIEIVEQLRQLAHDMKTVRESRLMSWALCVPRVATRSGSSSLFSPGKCQPTGAIEGAGYEDLLLAA
jgi:hypothetical protein